MHHLRSKLIELVLVAAPFAGTGCGDRGSRPPDANDGTPDPCSVSYQQIVKVEPEPPSQALLELVRACEADATKCDQLCQHILDLEAPAGSFLEDCMVTHTSNDHTIRVGYCYIGAEGRRPAGLAAGRKRCADATSGHLARAAFYEAASVHAFVQLARELRRHRAPRGLVAAARRSAAEEIRHARLMLGLAHVRGATPPAVVVTPPRRRSLEALAIENAREGLVGETWSAMIALWQSVHAPDPVLRATYARIADDELRHAELAVAIDRWSRSRLSQRAKMRVAAAHRHAVDELARQVRRAPDPVLVSDLGVPDQRASSQLFARARLQIWA